MSTILKTLRKLEEEKNVLEKDLGLKGMVLKGETSYPQAVRIERNRWVVIAALAVGGVLAGGGALYLWGPPQNHSAPIAPSSTETRTPPSVAKKVSTPPRFEGIPMLGIAGKEKPDSKPPSLRRRLTPPASEEAAPVPGQAPRETRPNSPNSDLEEIDRLIHSATSSAKQTAAAPPPGRQGQVPGLTVKGIIFFADGNPSNHIIVATPTHSNLKLRVGDSTENAVLRSIQPNRVVFIYQDQPVETGIGY